MSAIQPRYHRLGLKVIVKIFELADILEITPREATKLYLEQVLDTKTGKDAA